MSGARQRESKRLKNHFLIRYMVVGKPGVEIGNLENLSKGGLKFYASNPLAVEDDLTIEVLIPQWRERIAAHGKVCRVTRTKAGTYVIAIKFENISQETQDQVDEFIELLAEDAEFKELVE